MTNMKLHNLPYLLVYSRVIFGLIIGITAIINPEFSGLIIAFLMLTGILTDVFDGVIARKLKVDTKKLRVLDSNVDLFFWVVAILSVFGLNIHFMIDNIFLIFLVTFLEFLAYLITFLKFRKPIATHTYLAKFWSVLLFLFLTELVVSRQSHFLFHSVIWVGVFSRLEISGILLLSGEWVVDVSSVFHLQSSKKNS